jgi:hypothetical protein
MNSLRNHRKAYPAPKSSAAICLQCVAEPSGQLGCAAVLGGTDRLPPSGFVTNLEADR